MPPLSSAFPPAEAYVDAESYGSLGLSLTSCPFSAEPQAQFRRDILDSRAALHGKGGGSGLVLQPAPEGKTDQLPDAIPHQITYLQFQTGERLWIKEFYMPSQTGREWGAGGGGMQQGLLEKDRTFPCTHKSPRCWQAHSTVQWGTIPAGVCREAAGLATYGAYTQHPKLNGMSRSHLQNTYF